MINIGLIGESPYDTKAIKHLLQQKYNEGFRYTVLMKNITGNHLDTPKAVRAAVSEIKKNKPDIVVIIRDADEPESNHVVIREKHDWFNNLSGQIDKDSLFLLNIYELEALILADIETFNTEYKVKVIYKANVMHRPDPKEFLEEKTEKGHKKYEVSHCPELFKKLRFDVVKTNCSYFKVFIEKFESLMAQ